MGVIPHGDAECRFDYQLLETAIKGLVKNELNNENATMACLSEPHSCPTFVVATQGLHSDGPSVLFRSYSGNGFSADKCTIWEAGRATSAAPSFFKPVFIGKPGTGQDFIDGGLKHNNPSNLAKTEAENIWRNVKRFCIVSIGTGRQTPVHVTSPESKPTSSLWQRPQRLVMDRSVIRGGIALKHVAEVCVQLCTSLEEVHETMLREANSSDLDKRFTYYRFNVERGMETIGLQEWNKWKLIVAGTSRYMREGKGKQNRDACAHSLVDPLPIECKQTLV